MHDVVAAVVQEAVAELRTGFEVYWPSEGPNEMPEAHMLGALGRAFRNHGFHVFHEVHCRETLEQHVGHVDLVAMCTKRSLCVGVEGKRLYDGRGARAVLADWQRLERTLLAREHRVPDVRGHFRMVVATTWRAKIYSWWLSENGVPWQRDRAIWSELRSEMAGARFDALPIQESLDGKRQWLLYAFGERPRSFFLAADGT